MDISTQIELLMVAIIIIQITSLVVLTLNIKKNVPQEKKKNTKIELSKKDIEDAIRILYLRKQQRQTESQKNPTISTKSRRDQTLGQSRINRTEEDV